MAFNLQIIDFFSKIILYTFILGLHFRPAHYGQKTIILIIEKHITDITIILVPGLKEYSFKYTL